VWTSDRKRAEAIAGRLRSGSVMVNDVLSCYGIAEAPHGGRGASGWGRTHSRFGLLEMVQVKYVDSDLFPRGAKPWWFPYNHDLIDMAQGMFDALFATGAGKRLRGLGAAWRGYRLRRR
jgi:hypothetical protein